MTTANVHVADGTFHHAHHFQSAEHQYVSAKQGVWLFLATEILMFGVFFVSYGIFRGLYPELYQSASQHLNTTMGAANTVVLLFSSLTMAIAVHDTQSGNNKRAFYFLLITFLCAATFMVIKYFEYTHKFHLGIFPGKFFTFQTDVPNMGLFFSVYFVMTGLHGIHVLIGMGLIAWLMVKIKKNQISPAYYTPVEGVGLYWHIVDIIWIFLFPLLYLM